MKIMVLTSSPNKDGLTAACGEEARQGVVSVGAEAVMVRLNDFKIGACHACYNGWGTCRDKHECQVQDDFQKLHASMAEMDGFIIISPVYWGELSESAKSFIDRVRRSEALKEEKNFLEGKPVICVAAAGGTGNGCISCLESMERFINHVKAVKQDFIAITRRSRDYKLNTIKEAAKSLVLSLKA